MSKRHQCPKCCKRFTSAKAVRDHGRDVHGHDVEPVKLKRFARPVERYSEMSLAEISIEAQLKRAMGERLDPLEESLLFD